MDSSLKNPNYGQWLLHSAPSLPLPPPPPPISHQFHFDILNGYDRSNHHNYHNYTNRQEFPPQSLVNQQPSYYYSQPQPQPQQSYEPPWNIWLPSRNFSCTDSRDVVQSDWVGYMDRNYQLEYGNRTRDFSNGVFTRDLDGYSRFWDDGFCSLGYARNEFGESYRDSWQFKSESDRYCRSLGTGKSFDYGYDPTLHRDTMTHGTVNQRWVKGRESDRSRHERRFNSFRGKDRSDHGLVKKQIVDRKETSCTAGKVILSNVTSEGGVPFSGKSMSSLQCQPCEDEIPKKVMDDPLSRKLQIDEVSDNSFTIETNATTRVDSLDRTVVTQADTINFSQIQACENGVNSSVETVSRKDSMETTPLNSTTEVDHTLDSDAAIVRPFNHPKFSLVWTLKEPISRKANRVHISPQMIVPQPVSWKRETYWRRLMNPASVLLNCSFSITSRKLQMMRKRHTVYTRSTSRCSLKKSKVLSIGGSHLKWSESNERGSKKPEFLSDVKSSRSCPPESMKDTKISYIPKRLVIRNDKSVWIRNCKQLGGDPKKRTRALTNEKVRWSLNNVRLRLAKKMKYCQFFTRFGKCNKDDGKCPYVHDPSKIAVCTKFLSGMCANPDCKLTHEVVPESMPDCYYFLQGLCNNKSCPYRHVHAHQNAAICEGFLRGYCSDENECRKKHTYICPIFEATGSCSLGSECKLHHPKSLTKGKKRKRSSEPWHKNVSGRYFGSPRKYLLGSEPLFVNELAADGAVFGREALDFIRLDIDEHEASESMDSSTEESVSDYSKAQDSIEELIRPVELMQR